MKERVGVIYINTHEIVNNRDDLAKTFSMMELVVIRAEHLFHKDEIEYIAYSSVFDEIEEGEEVPVYNLEVSKDGESGEIVNVKAIRRTNEIQN